PSIGPLGACVEVCSSSFSRCEIPLQTAESVTHVCAQSVTHVFASSPPWPSPSGRGNPVRSGGAIETFRIRKQRRTFLPLPGGEGLGEGRGKGGRRSAGALNSVHGSQQLAERDVGTPCWLTLR